MTPPKNPRGFRATLSTLKHDRNAVGLKYVYPVLSRRSQGISIGVNLNPNNACNWRCIYCQVPNLTRGAAPNIDLALLESELQQVLDSIANGTFLDTEGAEPTYKVRDFALSGNGEPTSCSKLIDVLDIISRLKSKEAELAKLPIVLITNGSLAERPSVQQALRRLAEVGGVVWFKLDSATDEGLRSTNSVSTRAKRHLERLEAVARLCPTWVQTCWFCRDGNLPSDQETSTYLDALEALRARRVPLLGVQLYTLARPPLQPEGALLAPVSKAWLDSLGARLSAMGFAVTIAV